jgi:hypothetical protein
VTPGATDPQKAFFSPAPLTTALGIAGVQANIGVVLVRTRISIIIIIKIIMFRR